MYLPKNHIHIKLLLLFFQLLLIVKGRGLTQQHTPLQTLLMAIPTCPPFHIHPWESRADRLADQPKSIFSVLSFSLSKVEPHPPQPQTKQVFYINPIATPRFQNTASKVRSPSFIQPSNPPAPVCPRSVPSTSSNINVPVELSYHSSKGAERKAELMSQK